MFGSRKKNCCVEVPSNLEFFAQKYEYCDSNYLINNHTLLPLFISFLTSEQQQQVIFLVKNGGSGLYNKLGLATKGLNEKSSLAYCPFCIKEDISIYGEPYFHRIHQMPYILTCPTHGCFLEEYPVKLFRKNKQNLIKINCEIFNLDPYTFESDSYVAQNLHLVATNAMKILKYDKRFNLDIVNLNYLSFLKQRGFLRKSGTIKQQLLLDEFTKFYGLKFFEKMGLGPADMTYIFKYIGHIKRAIHPIKHILFIIFLSGSVESFFDNKEKVRELQIEDGRKRKKQSVKQYHPAPLDSGPWACLNPVADHYKQFVVNDCRITSGRKGIIRTFVCTCGYSYRKNVNQASEETFIKYRVRTFGGVWEQKLIEVMGEKSISISNAARIMGCDSATVITYAHKLGIYEEFLINSIRYKEVIKKNNVQKIYEKRQVLLKYMIKNSTMNRWQITLSLCAECTFLSRNDNEWLNNALPPAKGHLPRGKSMETFYDELDQAYYGLIVQTYDDLIILNKPKRITVTSLLNKVPQKRLTKQFLKLPRTSNLLAILPPYVRIVDVETNGKYP